jgi:hypothetical protein
MVKTCVAQEHGQGAFTLLSVIAHTEDARRYTSPVTFWNEQLAAVAGFANVKAMDRQRAKAVESGWLVYIPGAKAKPGKYWVAIPPEFSILDDGPTDEGCVDVSTDMNTSPDSTSNLTKKVGKQPGSNRELTGKQVGNIQPYPYPSPSPSQKPMSTQRARKGGMGVLTDWKKSDLTDDAKLIERFREAVAAGVIPDSEAMRLRFVAEAERVLSAKGVRNAAVMFVANVRKGLPDRLTDADEDRGRARLKRMRAGKVNDAAAQLAEKLGGPS